MSFLHEMFSLTKRKLLSFLLIMHSTLIYYRVGKGLYRFRHFAGSSASEIGEKRLRIHPNGGGRFWPRKIHLDQQSIPRGSVQK